MSRFARVTEEVLLRHKELAVEHHKTGRLGRSAHETLYLYLVILLHSWEAPYCKKTLPELCELYGLDPDNSYRRLKTLREKGWIAKTKKHIRPLLIHQSKTVTITDIPDEKTVTVTGKSPAKTVTVTPKNCNSYSKSGEKTVTVTVENDETSIPIKPSGDAKTSLNLKTVDSSTSSSNNSDSKSQFSVEECLRYVELRISRGERLETPHKLARWLHQTGEMDAFIMATLYPPPITPSEPQIEYADGEYEITAALELLRDIQAMGDDVEELKHFYAPEMWMRLMEELGKC